MCELLLAMLALSRKHLWFVEHGPGRRGGAIPAEEYQEAFGKQELF